MASLLIFPVATVKAENYKIGLVSSNDLRNSKVFRDIFDGATLALSEIGQEGSIVTIAPSQNGSLNEKLTLLNKESDLACTMVLASPSEPMKIIKGMNLLTNPILLMGLTATGESPWSSLYQLSPADDLQFEAMLTHSIKAGTAGSIFAIVPRTNESDIDKDILKSFLKKNILVTLIHLDENLTDNSGIRRNRNLSVKLKDSRPSAVFLGGSTGDVINTIVDLRNLKITCPIYLRLNETVENLDRLATMGDIFAVTAAAHIGSIPGEPGFIERFTATHKREPSSWAALAYDGANQIAKGTSLSKSINANLAEKLMKLPLQFGAGFAIDFSLDARWYPAISRLTEGKFLVVQLPGVSQLPYEKKRKIATSLTGQDSSKSNNTNSTQRSNQNAAKNIDGYPDDTKIGNKLNQNDITETGIVRKWNHFLVLPK
jgi:hypothetical protein